MAGVFYTVAQKAKGFYETEPEQRAAQERVIFDDAKHAAALDMLAAPTPGGVDLIDPEDVVTLRNNLGPDAAFFNAQPAWIRATVSTGLEIYAERGMLAAILGGV